MAGSARAWWRLPALLALLFVVVVIYGRLPRPCSKPLTYRIGRVDERFGISREEFREAMKNASSIWNKALFKNLLREDPKGDIEVNLVYDYRQEASDRLRSLSMKIDNTKGSYDDLKARFLDMKTDLERKMADLQSDFSAYNARVTAFNAESTRNGGSVPEPVFRRLAAEREELKTLQEELHRRQVALKEQEETVNSMVVVLNEMAQYHNLELVNYKNTGATLGKEFTEGHYVRHGRVESITIYHIPSPKGLVRVLTHEFGHALGLEHAEDPQAIMHRVSRSESWELAPEELAALKARCKKRFSL